MYGKIDKSHSFPAEDGSIFWIRETTASIINAETHQADHSPGESLQNLPF
jgi:hypothetical protein